MTMAIYLLNPFTVLSCVAGTTSPFENLAVLVALYGACAGDLVLTGLALSIGGYLGIHPLLLLVSYILFPVNLSPENTPLPVYHLTVPNCHLYTSLQTHI